MTTAQRLWLGFGMLTALTVVSSGAILVRVWSIRNEVDQMANITRPRSEAAQQLEINVLDYALGVRWFLQSADAAVREEAAKDAADARRSLKEYERLATSERQREMALRFAAMWQELESFGEALLDSGASPLQPNDALRFHARHAALEKFLDEELQIDANAAYNASKDRALHDLQRIVDFLLILLVLGAATAAMTGVAVGRSVVAAERRIREIDDELRASVAGLAAGDRHKNAFLAMLSHELRDPLAAIRNSQRVLTRTPGNSDAVRSAAEIIERQSGHMLRLVDDLLDISRVTLGKVELRKEPIELAAVVGHAVETARPLIEARVMN